MTWMTKIEAGIHISKEQAKAWGGKRFNMSEDRKTCRVNTEKWKGLEWYELRDKCGPIM